MIKLKVVILMIILGSYSIQVSAATTIGTIKRLHIYNEIAYIELYLQVKNKPLCATNDNWSFNFDPKSVIGALKYSTLLTAFKSGNQVEIENLNVCTIGTGQVTNMGYLIITN